MKHKAQEVLDCLFDENQMDKFAKGFSRDDNYTSQFDYDNAQNYCFDKLKELIDCQLTMEEISTISTAINHLEVDYSTDNLLPAENKSLKRIVGIRSKLLKQKEMWEEE